MTSLRNARRSPWPMAVTVGVATVVAWIGLHARYGAVSPRIRNPEDTGARHPLSDPLFGYGKWIETLEIFSYAALISIIVLVVVLWRRYPRHPYLLMTIAVSSLAWLDAPMNWATFAAYNPDLWHWPEDWPIVSLSPTIEPLFIAAIAMFVVPPFFPAIWALRRLQARRPPTPTVSRRPLICLAGLVFISGFITTSQWNSCASAWVCTRSPRSYRSARCSSVPAGSSRCCGNPR